MTFQASAAVRNARLDAVESTIGASALLRLYTGAEPANCAAAATGTKLVEMALPADWMNDAAGGTKTLKGAWSGAGIAAGDAAYFRIYDTSGVNCGLQGSVTLSGGGGDMTLDNTNIQVAQIVTVSSYTLTEGNA